MNKFAITFVLVGAVFELCLSITNEQKAEIQSQFISVGESCAKQHPLSKEDIDAFRQRKFPDGENAGCFSACVLRDIGFIDEKGYLSREAALEHARGIFQDGEEIKTVEEFVDTCYQVNDESVTDGEKGCDRAKLLFHCFVENLDKFDF